MNVQEPFSLNCVMPCWVTNNWVGGRYKVILRKGSKPKLEGRESYMSPWVCTYSCVGGRGG